MGRILVVEDHVETCRVMARLLQRYGHEAYCVYSGEQALAHMAVGPRPDVVLLDAMMPGMDGIEVLRQLQADPETAGVPVVMCSAISDPTFVDHALAKGASDYVVKSTFAIEDLLRRLGRFMSSSSAAAPVSARVAT
jgi:CheY-like chemotaxis protein